MESNVVLRVKNVSKKYGNRIAVDNVSFDVFAGKIFGFLGPNGAGKTTTLKMITGLCKLETGNILVCGYNIKSQFEKAITNIGAVIESPQMYNNFSGLDNLKYFASLYKNVDINRINEVVKIVGLSDRIKDKVKTYSLGMKQRLGIAQALLHRPKVLILDEPTNGLDPSGVVEIRKFLKKIATQEGIGILISSHILAEMEMMCDSIGIINNGRLENIREINQLNIMSDTEQVLIKVNFPNYAGKIIDQKFKPEKIRIIKDNLTVNISHDKIPDITMALVTNGIAIYSISAVTRTLEDLFLDTINKRALPPPKNN